MNRRVPSVLTIAGSDSGAGAGIQADLKTFAAMGVFGTTAITAITAQNTLGVQDVLALPPELVAAQIDAVVSDIGADVVKTGMLANADIVNVVVAKVRERALSPLVVDPVMVSSSGDRLFEDDAVDAIRERLLPLATIITPNLREAEVLLGRTLTSWEEIRAGVEELVAMGAGAAIIKGGHPIEGSKGAATDLLFDSEGLREYTTTRIESNNTHGTGCTFASAIAAALARGTNLRGSVAMAKAFVTKALQSAYPVGEGHGPVHHFFRFWQPGLYDRLHDDQVQEEAAREAAADSK
ncbi:MAG: bifunctional hydroxymethylpyrimidine kinase/phosphomethylpyrimidine kinase [Chloroflexi bacterium]|nr:bifunctional hydroxymethylpyrimidine kinase/phosphomethylpyrimidine kinase [Chloroflexota bacterium]